METPEMPAPTARPTFRAKQVCIALSIPPGSLSSWAHAGRLRDLTAGITRQGKARYFTDEDVVRLAIMKAITEAGIALDDAASWSGLCLNYMDQYGPEVTEFNVLFFEDSMEVRLNNEVMADPQPSGAYIRFTIFPWEIAAAIKEKLGAGLAAAEKASGRTEPAEPRRLGAPKRAPNRRRKPQTFKLTAVK
jgi:hypothetical protein